MESGIEVHTITVALHDPSSNSTMMPTSAPAVSHFMTTSSIESLTKVEASSRSLIFTPSGTICSARGIIFLIPSTTSRVEASVLFITMMMTVCLPFTSTAFCCTRPMRRTVATSRR